MDYNSSCVDNYMMDSPYQHTPKNKCRRLGLSRPVTKFGSPVASPNNPKHRTPLLSNGGARYSPKTPDPTESSSEKNIPKSNSCGPLRMGLSRNTNVANRKKLHFTPTSRKNETPSSLHGDEVGVLSTPPSTPEQKTRQQKVDTLKASINMYKEAFKNSLEELAELIEPKIEKEELICRLGLDPDMAAYV